MNIINVKGNTYCIETGMSYIPFYKINDNEIIMLDTGLEKGEREIIDAVIENNNFKVVGIINSHAHMDHIGNNAYLKNKFNCIIAMPTYEAIICSSYANLKVYYGAYALKDIKKKFGHMICKTDIKIDDNDNEIDICNTKFKIIHTPGHSPSHISIITPDNVVYLGDALVSYELMNGAKMPYAYILSEDMKSKAKLYDLNCSKYIVSHKGIYENIKKLIDDNIDFYENRSNAIYELITQPMTMEEILKVACHKFEINIYDIKKYNMMSMMLKSYVDYLYEIGKLKVIIDDGLLKYIK